MHSWAAESKKQSIANEFILGRQKAKSNSLLPSKNASIASKQLKCDCIVNPQHVTLEYNSAECLLPPKNELTGLFSDEVRAMCSKFLWEFSGGTNDEVPIQPQI